MTGGNFGKEQEKRNKGLSVRKWLCSTSLVVLVGAMAPVVHAQEWTGGVSNDWTNAGNWQGGSVPPSGGNVYINNEGAGWPRITGTNHTVNSVVIADTASGGSLLIASGGTLTLSQAAEIGVNYTGSATVTGAGSVWNIAGLLDLGFVGHGTLNVSDSGRVNSQDGYIGLRAQGTGIANIDSGGTWIMSRDLFAGYEGTGTLNIVSAGTVSAGTTYAGFFGSSTGTITIDGANSLLTTGGFVVGREGEGHVIATNGGAIESQSGIIGREAGSVGSVDLQSGSLWIADTAVTVGAAGIGTLTVAGGSKLTSDIATVGRNVGGTGTATVSDNGSNWTNTGDFTIARDGTGTMTVTGEGASVNSGRLIIGDTAGSNGTLTLANDGTWTSTQDASIGDGGTGKLVINGGGWLTTVGGQVGTVAGSNGTVEINSAAVSNRVSTWDATTGDITIGGAGSGSLTVSSGGRLYTDGARIGVGTGGNGTILVTGSGTTWNAEGGGIFVGDNGGASLTVTNQALLQADAINVGNTGASATMTASGGATVASTNLNIGYGTGRRGAATITGAGTNWTASGVFVGLQADGALTIADGARLLSADSSIGSLAGITGNVLVTGANSVWELTAGHISVGGAGTGTLAVENGGRVDGDVDVLGGGTLRGNGTVGDTQIANGGTLVGVQGQTMTINGNLALVSNGSNVNVTLGSPGNAAGLFQVNGDLVLNGTLNVTNAGGFGQGVYRIIDYTGSLTDNDLIVGTMPSGTTGTVQTGVPKQVNLVVAGGGMPGAVQFWNGTTMVADGTIHGGNGSWNASLNTNWTDANGATASTWGSQFAVFQNAPGIVTVDGSYGNVTATGMQFIGQNWLVTGDPITLADSGGNSTIRVGDGTAAGASHVATIESELNGSSRLVKDDLGTLILTGSNYYTGGTTIAAGTLQIGDAGTIGTITGDVLNNGLLRFSRTDATTFGGLISGSGAVHVAHGQLTLTGNNTYTGETTIGSVASLTLGDGGTTGSVSGNIVNNGLLRFNRSNDLTYAGVISGYGAIRQIGSGKAELTGNSSAYTGSTTVENGILAVNGQLGGALDVWAGGRLQGTGTVGNTIVSGVIAPGNSIGTLNVGNITFMGGSIYEVEVKATGQTDLIKASGTATINGGSVQVLAGSGNYAPQTQYTILTATGGRNGNFAGVTSNLAFLDPSLSYDANNVYVTMTRNDILFQNVGVTPNQIATGGGVESLGLGNAVYDAVLNLSAPQAQYAFDQLSGEIHASAKTAMLEDSRFIRNAVNDRIRAAFDGVGASNGNVVTYDNGRPQAVAANTDGGAVWGHAFGAWGHWNGDGNAARLDRSIGGFFVGADAPAFDTWRFGAVAGYSRTSFDTKDRHSSGTSDNYHVGLYGGTNWGDLAFRTGAAYTWHDISTNRSVIFPGFGNSLTGDYGASTAQVFGELGYKMQAGNVAFEPFANLAYVNLHTEGFTEKGGAAALTSGSSSTDATFTTLGLRAASSFNLGETVVTAKGMVGWRHAFGDVTPDSVMRFAGGGNAFTIGGVPIARNAAVVEAGLDFALSPTATLGVSYGGQFGSGVVDQSVRANFNVKF